MIASMEWTSQRVRRLRGKRTQAEFGQLIGVPKNTIWRWEAGYARPDAERAARLSRLAKKRTVSSTLGIGWIGGTTG